jgi:ankyrin repeat protein
VKRSILSVYASLAGLFLCLNVGAALLVIFAQKDRWALYLVAAIFLICAVAIVAVLYSQSLRDTLLSRCWCGDEPGSRAAGEEAVEGDSSMEPRNEPGWTPLHEATVIGDSAAAGYLLDDDESLSARDALGFTPLHQACRLMNKDMAKFLVSRGAPMEAQDTIGWTPLHIAIGMGARDIVEFLLESGADPEAETLADGTAVEIAGQQGKDDIAAMLEHYIEKRRAGK